MRIQLTSAGEWAYTLKPGSGQLPLPVPARGPREVGAPPPSFTTQLSEKQRAVEGTLCVQTHSQKRRTERRDELPVLLIQLESQTATTTVRIHAEYLYKRTIKA